MQQKETLNDAEIHDVRSIPPTGRIIALDPGTVRVGLAVCDETQLVARPLPAIGRRSWKKLLSEIRSVIAKFDAAALIVGLPLNTDGSESPMSTEARDMARKFALSLDIPVFLEDERSTSYAAKKRLWDRGVQLQDTGKLVDGEAASIILSDFLDRLHSQR